MKQQVLRPDNGYWEPTEGSPYGLRHEYEFAPEPVGALNDEWQHVCEFVGDQRATKHVALPWPSRGVFVPRGYLQTGKAHPPRSLARVGESEKDTSGDVAPLLTALLAVDSDDAESLLTFVNQWGLLGIGTRVSAFGFPYEGVMETSQWTKARQLWLIAWDDYLKSSPKPLLVGPPMSLWTPYDGPPDEHVKNEWVISRFAKMQRTPAAFAQMLNPLVGSVRLAVRHDENTRRLWPMFWYRTLADRINAELWYHATEGRTMRFCRGCKSRFTPSRPNRRHHSDDCKNRFNVQAFRKKHRRTTRRKDAAHGTKRR